MTDYVQIGYQAITGYAWRSIVSGSSTHNTSILFRQAQIMHGGESKQDTDTLLLSKFCYAVLVGQVSEYERRKSDDRTFP